MILRGVCFLARIARSKWERDTASWSFWIKYLKIFIDFQIYENLLTKMFTVSCSPCILAIQVRKQTPLKIWFWGGSVFWPKLLRIKLGEIHITVDFQHFHRFVNIENKIQNDELAVSRSQLLLAIRVRKQTPLKIKF